MTKKLTARDLKMFRTALEQARSVVLGDMDLLEAEALGNNGAPTHDAPGGDSSEGYFQEFNLELLERDGTTLREIQDALERIDGGVYGQCEDCEAWIARERLKAVPYTRHCIDCKRRLETEGA
mgnify:CR=1 FL=1